MVVRERVDRLQRVCVCVCVCVRACCAQNSTSAKKTSPRTTPVAPDEGFRNENHHNHNDNDNKHLAFKSRPSAVCDTFDMSRNQIG